MNFDADIACLIGDAAAQKFQTKKVVVVKRRSR
jgi:hypothetical protein